MKPDALDHIPTELRKMISEDVDKYLKIAGLTKFKVRILYSNVNDNKDTTISNDRNKDYSTVAASTNINLPYLVADMRIHPFLVNQWKEGYFTDDDIHDIISHEIAHIATHRLYQLCCSSYKSEEEAHNSWEELTTLLGRTFGTIDNLNQLLTNRK